MSPSFAASLARTSAILLAVAMAGAFAARALWPKGRILAAERIAWGFALGLASVAASESILLAAGASPRGWAIYAGLLSVALAGRFVFRLRSPKAMLGPAGVATAPGALLLGVAAAGVALYALRALAEPMWANDFLAIWGLKAKAIFLSGGVPPWLQDSRVAGFSHPEYPLGLPLLFAGLSTAAGRWDDHAMALLYPALQIATLAALAGWLRRRGASRLVAYGTAAVVSLFEPLYSAFLTGMAEVPVSAALLLLGCALCDALDGTDPGAGRRLAAASLFAAAMKNEGSFCAAAAGAAALWAGVRVPGLRSRAWRAAAAAIAPAAGLFLLRRVALGAAPLRDFDAGLLSPARWGELAARAAIALRSAAALAAPAWPILLAVAVIFACGSPSRAGRRLLGIAVAAEVVYLLIPALAVLGPDWLARTTLPRTSAALAPLVAAGLAVRFAPGEPPGA